MKSLSILCNQRSKVKKPFFAHFSISIWSKTIKFGKQVLPITLETCAKKILKPTNRRAARVISIYFQGQQWYGGETWDTEVC